MPDAIIADHLRFDYGHGSVIRDVAFTAASGRITGLLGPSGAGKTTLLKILTGQLQGYEGNVSVFGRDASAETANCQQGMGLMMDSLGTYDRMTVLENLELTVRLRKLNPSRILKVLKDVELWDAQGVPAAKLSRGMRSRLALARALLTDSRLLVLDEPTTGLDPGSTEVIHTLLKAKRGDGAAVLLSTHNMHEAQELCDRVDLLHEGRIVESGTPAEILRRHDHLSQVRITKRDGTIITVPKGPGGAEAVRSLLQNAEVDAIHSTEPNLEEVFLECTGRRLQIA